MTLCPLKVSASATGTIHKVKREGGGEGRTEVEWGVKDIPGGRGGG